MFELPETTRITKEFLLSKNTEETYMQTYLGIPVKKELQVSPLRNDKNPTASFYRNKRNDLIFHDFGTGFHGNFISVVMELYNCGFAAALRLIAVDFNLVKSNTPPTKKIIISNTTYEEKGSTVIQVETQEFTQSELDWWSSFGISLKTLNKYRVYSCKNVFVNGNYFTGSTPKCPIFGYYGGKRNGMEMWRIYFPTKTVYRFISNWQSTYIQGSKQLSLGETCILTKSLKDVMLLDTYDFTACAPNGETVILPPSQFKKLEGKSKEVIVFFDNDLPGVKGAHKYKKEYNCRCIFLRRGFAKDISDMYKNISAKQFKETVEELNLIIADKTVRKTKHFYIF